MVRWGAILTGALALGLGGCVDGCGSGSSGPVVGAGPVEGPPPELRCGEHPSAGCFVPIAGATYLRGAQSTDPNGPGYDPMARPDEGPVRSITVSPFWIQSDETVFNALARCRHHGGCDDVTSTPELTEADHDRLRDRPLTGVDWAGAQAVCHALGGRLPTEAEWELAARGPEGWRYPLGEYPRCPMADLDGELRRAQEQERLRAACEPTLLALRDQLSTADFDRIESHLGDRWALEDLIALCLEVAPLDPAARAAEVKRRVDAGPPTNDLSNCRVDGVVDSSRLMRGGANDLLGMAGNVWEWVEDWYQPDAYASGPDVDPHGPDHGERRVQRGGSWLTEDPAELRSAARDALEPDAHLGEVGFRCVWVP